MSPSEWGDDGWAVVSVKVTRCEGCETCADEPRDLLGMVDPQPVCSRCLHPWCPQGVGR